MLPVIALLGRPNVGKSTLFNRLTQSRDALVADYPGLTRDRQYGIGSIGPGPYVVVDTGGISQRADGIEALMDRQVRLAIEEADHLLFLVDAKDGCAPGDVDIAAQLRRYGKPITLVVNKSDVMDPALATADFHRLGLGEPKAVSATHGRGVRDLIAHVLSQFPEPSDAGEVDEDETGIRVAVVGRPNAGKSTLINRILGDDRLVTFDQPGTTRDSIFIPFERLGRHFTLIDTAGMRRRSRIDDVIEKFSVIKTLQAIDAAHVVILVLDAHAGIGDQDATLAAHIVERGRALVVAVNKWDGLGTEERARVKQHMARRLGFLDFAKTHLVSALHGSGVGLLLDGVEQSYASATRNLSTPELTRLLEAAVQEHQPPLVHGRRIKLRYAHQGGRNPPIIVVHGKQTDAIPDAYRRYLIARFRRELALTGTPLRVEFKSGDNPFEGRPNPLTARQVKHRQRLKRFVNRKSSS